ncbi:hypothetical protein IWX58_004392 [Rubrivivax gelatinosus]|nr:hypothetical protein [Rubrivivax gelatinosus]
MTQDTDRGPSGPNAPATLAAPATPSGPESITQPTKEELRKSGLLKLLRMDPAKRERLIELERLRRGLPKG